MSGISTHVLDIARGKPARGVQVRIERLGPHDSSWLGEQRTNEDGRVASLLSGDQLSVGTYRITFVLAPYFEEHGLPVFYPEAQIVFQISDVALHHHIPLLLSPFGYSTYRGS